jgi:uncharacterized protein (DUF924 family)
VTAAPESVLAFWFGEAGPDKWFAPDEAFDGLCRERLGTLHESAAAGELDHWRATPEGALALVILLDQVPRNIFRGTPRAFATDGLARAVAGEAIARGFDEEMALDRRIFLYIPFEHGESLEDQKRALELFSIFREIDPEKFTYAERHAEIIRRFGRFPHRNAILGRASTPEEIAFLKEPGSGF